MSWRTVVKAVVGLGIGVFCLVAWSSTSSAAEPAPTPPPPGLLTPLTNQLLPPVQQLTDSLGLGPVVNPVVDEVVAPTVAGLDSAVITLVDGTVVPLVDGVAVALGPTVDELSSLLGLPSGPFLPGPGQPQVPALPLPGPGTSPLIDPAGAAAVPTVAGVAESAVPAPAGATPWEAWSSAASPSDPTSPTGGRVTGHGTVPDASMTATPADDASPLPFSVPVLPAVLGGAGAVMSSAANASSVGLLLVAVLAGVAALAVTPVWRRLSALGLLTPRAVTFAIATPPG